MVIDVGRIKHLGDLMHKSIASNGTAVTSNWKLSADGLQNVVWTPESASSVSYGSNSNEVTYNNAPGASSLVSRADHQHRGVTSLAHASNTYTGPVTLETEGGLYIVRSAANTYRLGSTGGSGGGGSLTVEEVDGSPSVAATKLVLPNGTLGVVGTVATYTPAGGGGVTHSYIGYNTVGGSWESATVNRIYAKKVTLAAAGFITAIGAYVQATTSDSVGAGFGIAVFDDNAGTPDNIIFHVPGIADTLLLDDTAGAGGASKPRWLHKPCGIYLPAGDYWIACQFNDASDTIQLAYDGSGSDRYYTSGGGWQADWGFYAPTTSSNRYSIRGSLLT